MMLLLRIYLAIAFIVFATVLIDIESKDIGEWKPALIFSLIVGIAWPVSVSTAIAMLWWSIADKKTKKQKEEE